MPARQAEHPQRDVDQCVHAAARKLAQANDHAASARRLAATGPCDESRAPPSRRSAGSRLLARRFSLLHARAVRPVAAVFVAIVPLLGRMR